MGSLQDRSIASNMKDIDMAHFPTHAVLSTCTGRLMGDIGGVYQVMSYMLGRDAYTHELAHYGKQAAAALQAAHPGLPGEDDFEHVNGDNVHDVLDTWIAKLGPTIDLDASLSECLADDRDAIDVLKEMKPDAEVIVVNHKPES